MTDLSLDQLQTVNYILLRGHTPKDVLNTFARPEFSSDSMNIIAAAFEGAHFITDTGEKAPTKEQVERILYPSYTPEQQLAMLSIMRGGSPAALLSDETFARLFSPSTSVDRMHAIAHALNKLGLDAQTVEHYATLPSGLTPAQLYVVFDAAASEKVPADAVELIADSPELSPRQMHSLLMDAEDGTPVTALASHRDSILAQDESEKSQGADSGVKSESRDMATGADALSEQTETKEVPAIDQSKEVE